MLLAAMNFFGSVILKPFDRNALVGGSGLLATITLPMVHTTIACLVGIATCFYMTFKGLREYRKWKSKE
jgi:hypothetical protein